MKSVLLDTNIVLDVLLDRRPNAEASSGVWIAIERKQVKGFLAGHAVTTVHYFLRKALSAPQARRAMMAMLKVFDVAAIDQEVIDEAMRSNAVDFEDAVTSAAAHLAGCDYLITRDPKGFRSSPVEALTPELFLAILAAG